MTQAAVLAFLKKKKKWIKTIDISKGIKIKSAADNLRKLFKYGEVFRKPLGLTNGYAWKAR